MKNKLSKLIILFSLIFTWGILTVVYVYSTSNITVINTSLDERTLTHKTFNEFLKGDKISGEFTPGQNYLGQVLIRFYNYERINKDEVTFRLQEKGQNSWYYEHTYKTDQFLPNNLFTFGFPIIADSKGKTYHFEILSVDGTPEQSITLSRDLPIAALSFQYPKGLLVKNKDLLLEFASNRVNNTKVTKDFLSTLISYLDFILLIILLEYMLLKSLFKSSFSSLVRVRGVYFIILAMIVIVLSAILLYLKRPQLSESVSISGYFLLIIGVIWIAIESKLSKSSS